MTSELSTVALNLAAARGSLDQAMAAARDAAGQAWLAGTPETVIARELGVNRMTVRKWLGKL